MASVMQGDAYNIPVTIKSGNGTLITPEIAACVEITVGQFTKRWPGQVTFDEKTGEWQFPVTQKQTFRFAPGAAVVQARVVFQDGSIMGGSGAPVRVEQSASHGTLPQPEKTEAVTGSAPKATEVTIPTVHDIDVSLHSQVILSDPIKAPYIGDNGNWYEYDAATGTFIDTGTSASGTPPITPDTAGKYLTNDGSKAEWGEVKESLEVGDAKDGNLLKLGGSDVLNAATPNVDYALPTLYVTITQDGQDSDGNPIYKSDKTYAEIKAAHEAGREVKIALAGLFSFENIDLSSLGINDLPLISVAADFIIFGSSGIPSPDLVDSYTVGGQAVSVASVLIRNNAEVRVLLPYKVRPDEWEPRFINKLPQQYIINVTEGKDGTLTADWSYEQIKNIINAYETFSGGTALFCVMFEGSIYMPIDWDIDSRSLAFVEIRSLSVIISVSADNVWIKDDWSIGFPVFNVVNGKIYDRDGKEISVTGIPYYSKTRPIIYSNGRNYFPINNPDYVNFDLFALNISDDGQLSYSKMVLNRRGDSVTVSDFETIRQLPKVTTADNGKFLRVVDGQWAAEAVATAKGVSF